MCLQIIPENIVVSSHSLKIQGGGWCNTIDSCSFRKLTALGSSKYMDRQVQFSGILSSDQSHNPGNLLLPVSLGFLV